MGDKQNLLLFKPPMLFFLLLLFCQEYHRGGVVPLSVHKEVHDVPFVPLLVMVTLITWVVLCQPTFFTGK